MNAYQVSKADLFMYSAGICATFLELNGVAWPKKVEDRVIPTGRPPSGSYGCGVYLPRLQQIMVNSAACANPARGTPRQFSFPGYSVDRTPVGVLAHEIGHYVDHVHGYVSNSPDWQNAIRGSKVSSYEPNASESFAESMRLYILNPELLRAIAPRRHEFMAVNLDLDVLGRENPLSVLRARGAAEGILAACENKLIKAHYVVPTRAAA